MNIYKHIDYTLLKPTATYNDIWSLCDEATKKECASVCVPSHFVEFVSKHFVHLPICTVVGFPLGNSTTETKLAETITAIKNGADEIDMVINISEMKNGNYWYIENEINQILDITMKNCRILKVIIETCYLTEEEIAIATRLVDSTEADYVKTSTGFGTRGASYKDIEIIKSNIYNDTKIKASGGIKTREEMETYITLGCDRIGTSKLP